MSRDENSEAAAGRASTSLEPPADMGELSDAVQHLILDKVSHAIDGLPVLEDVSVTIREGEFFTLLGPSGCGKTTLLRLIAGFESPDAGTLSLGGLTLGPLPAARRPINTVFQNYALFPHLNVASNVAFGLKMLKWSRADIADRVDEVLRLVRMFELRHRRIGELSGGQQQRVALARALAPSPKVLLLDEPLSALDVSLRREMQVELKRIQTELRQTVIFVTHDQEEALSMSDRIAVMKDGRILQCDTPESLYARPANRFVAGFLGEANFLAARLRTLDNFSASVELFHGQIAKIDLGHYLPSPGMVTLMIRPEDVELGVGTGLTASARITGKTFLGSDVCLNLVLRDGTVIRLRSRASSKTEQVSIGQQVDITFPLQSLRLVGEAG